MRVVRLLLILSLGVMLALGAFVAIGLHNARADPIVRRAAIGLPDWPRGAKPVRVALISDIHMGSRAMDAARLGRIVDQINALSPDLVVIAGDLINGNDPREGARAMAALIGPLSRLHPPLGTVASIGNHDQWTSPGVIAAWLRKANVTLLADQAERRGPLVLGGMIYSAQDGLHLWTTLPAMYRLKGPRVLISHSPEISPVVPSDIPLILAGHTHCGQIVLPLIGVAHATLHYGDRYLCGLKRVDGRIVVVSAGLGTSVVPLRYGAPPDLWLLTLGPRAQPAQPARSSAPAPDTGAGRATRLS